MKETKLITLDRLCMYCAANKYLSDGRSECTNKANKSGEIEDPECPIWKNLPNAELHVINNPGIKLKVFEKR